MSQSEDAAVRIRTIIKQFVNESSENTLQNKEGEKAWDEPLVGFSSGGDPIYQFYKMDIGEFHLTPLEIFSRAFPNHKISPDQLTVISWVLPQTRATKSDNRMQTRFPSERWARARFYGEEVNNKLRRHVVANLMEAGIEAVPPLLSPLYESKESKLYGRASTWSERHAAYTSGLGTFGLCDGLITSKGKAIRCGSVIARMQAQPSERPYTHHKEYCLFYSKGICGKCINRCPPAAISRDGHDKAKCSAYLKITREYVRSNYGFEGYGCGLCQTKVPCESGIPTRNLRKADESY